jgi:hypothetical protein
MSLDSKAKTFCEIYHGHINWEQMLVPLEDVQKDRIATARFIEQQLTDSPKHSFTYGDVLRILVRAFPELKTATNGKKETGDKE